MIEISNVSKRYGTRRKFITVFGDVNLTINKGDYIWLKGRSGSGKTTLLNLTSGLDLPTDGNVTLLGVNTRQYRGNRMAKIRNAQIGFVFQIFPLLDGTVFRNVALPLQFRHISKNEIKNKVFNMLETVGLKGHAQKHVSQLSGGEQQRVVFARALVKDPEIVFADEPFSNLDDETSTPLINLLADLHKEGKTIFLVTHSYEHRINPTKTFILEAGALSQL
ncbi:MAG: ABC transporter ATP-binding protein [bacterium]